MRDEIDWSRWRRTPRGYERVAPAVGPCGHRWTQRGPGRPMERSVTCTCTMSRHHTAWVCPACGSYCAEGCLDVRAWAGTTVPAGLPLSRRFTLGGPR